MSFADPIVGLIAAGVALPLLILLYFLKLKRRPERVPSTLLWRSAVRDLEANTPFQRLKPSWLFWLQLLALLALLVAVARPIAGRRGSGASGRIILIVDVSAQMAARTGEDADGPSRLDQEKEAARGVIRRLSHSSEATEVMIIKVAGQARIVHPFSSHRASLLSAIDSLDIVEQALQLEPAFRIAQAHLTASDDAENVAGSTTRVILLSSGRSEDETLPGLEGQSVEFIVPETSEAAQYANAGITVLSARRTADDPEVVEVLVVVVNCAEQPRSTTVNLEVNGRAEQTRAVTIPAAQAEDEAVGESVVVFNVGIVDSALVRVFLSGRDALALDDSAAIEITPRRLRRVLLVHRASPAGADEFLMNVLTVLSAARTDVMAIDRFDDLAAISTFVNVAGTQRPYDLIIFDRCEPQITPLQPTLSFGADRPAALLQTVLAPEPIADRRILTWDRSERIMANVSLDGVIVSDRRRVVKSNKARELAYAQGGPVIVAYMVDRVAEHVVVSFQLRKSNWPILPSFAVFMLNTVDELTRSRADDAGRAVRSVEMISRKAGAGISVVTLTGPAEITTQTGADGTATLGPFDRVGLYEATGLAGTSSLIPVNLLSRSASDLRPVRELNFAGESIWAASIDRAAPNELWPWLLAVCVGLMLIEWVLYVITARQ